MSQRFAHEPINFNRLPGAIKALMIANVAIFVVAQFVGPRFYDLFGLVPVSVLKDRWIWQPVTYLFIHGSIFHLIFNLFALWMFGMPAERAWGGKEFLKYYFICGLGAALATLLLTPTSGVPVIGASGPVYGLLVAFAMLYPDAVVYLYFLIPVKAAHMAILFGIIEFFAGATSSSPGVARFAHLGGMVTGFLYIRYSNWAGLAVRGWARRLGGGGDESTPEPRRRLTRRPAAEPQDEMAQIDRILDKILVSGMDSLTPEEREIMKRYSDKQQKH